MYPLQDGVILAADAPFPSSTEMLWDILSAASLNLCSTIIIPHLAPPKLVSMHLEAANCCSSCEAKTKPDTVVSTLFFRVADIFIILKKAGGNGLERKYADKS